MNSYWTHKEDSTVCYMVWLHQVQNEHQGRSSVQLQPPSCTENRIVVQRLKMSTIIVGQNWYSSIQGAWAGLLSSLAGQVLQTAQVLEEACYHPRTGRYRLPMDCRQQFGFKAADGTDRALFSLMQTVNFYRGQDRPECMCFSWFPKEFDIVNQ